MKTLKSLYSLSAALALHSTAETRSAPEESEQSRPADSLVIGNVTSSLRPHPIDIPRKSEFTQGTPSEFKQNYVVDQGWTAARDRRYRMLVRAEALEKISEKEVRELEVLEKLRRDYVNPPTGEELIRRYKLEMFDSQLVELLSKYADLKNSAPDPAKREST